MKRVKPYENSSLAAAWAQYSDPAHPSDGGVTDWYTGRDDVLTLDHGSDYATSWGPRQWHPNTWAYRKAIAYGSWLGYHTNASTSAMFVKIAGTGGQFAAVNWGCSGSGCSQVLLDVRQTAAQNFWLYGAETAPGGGVGALRTGPPTSIPSAADCKNFGARQHEGVLGLLVCGYKGLWLDDVYSDLFWHNTSSDPSVVANLTTGQTLSGGDIAAGKLGFNEQQWEDGVVTLMTRLRNEINALKTAGLIPSSAGKVAINYKWEQYGFAKYGDSPTLTTGAKAVMAKADFVELEHGFVDGGIAANPASGEPNYATPIRRPYSYARRREYVRQVHAAGYPVLEELTNSADMGLTGCQSRESDAAHFTAAQYNLASTLLNWKPGDMVGDICDYPKAGWDGYLTDLGAPAVPYSVSAPDGGVYTTPQGFLRRDFERGSVIVAPPGISGTITLSSPMDMRANNSASNTVQRVSSVTLSQRQGAVLMNPTGVLNDHVDDSKTDLPLYRASNKTWTVFNMAGTYWQDNLGGASGSPVPGDYFGNSKSDMALYNATTQTWTIKPFMGGSTWTLNWGVANAVAVPGDYVGDSRADLALYQPSTGKWFIRTVSSPYVWTVNWGTPGEIPVPGDYVDDDKYDFAMYKPATSTSFGHWSIRSLDVVGWGFDWGSVGEVPVPGDYVETGKADLTMHNSGTGNWWIRSFQTVGWPQSWGSAGEIATPGDFVGDGKADFGVYNSTTHKWWIRSWDVPGGWPAVSAGTDGESPVPVVPVMP